MPHAEKQVITVDLADAAAADKDYYVVPMGAGEWELTGFTFVPSSAGAAVTDGTEHRTLTASIGGTNIAVITTNSGTTGFVALVAGTPAACTTFTAGGTATSAANTATGGTDACKIASVHGGATGKLANGNAVCEFTKRRA